MVKVSENVYGDTNGDGDGTDVGDVGDGNLSHRLQFPSGTETRRTDFAYDWRDRLVASKGGAETSEGTAVNRPISYSEFDNLGQVVVSEQYDGDGLSIATDANSDGVPDRPSSGSLRAKSTAAYDELGRAFQAKAFSVNPASGSVSANALTTNFWFDASGQVIKASGPGGLVSKTAYDGLGRPITRYTTDGGGDAGYEDADDVTGDVVLTQTETQYDLDGNVLQTTAHARFHDETGTGALGTPATGVKARVSHAVMYYDRLDRPTAAVDVGTNGGSAYTRPGTVPARSDTVLVTEFGYDVAGRQVSVTDPLGLIASTEYDALGRTTKTIENGIIGAADDKNKTAWPPTTRAAGSRPPLRPGRGPAGDRERMCIRPAACEQ